MSALLSESITIPAPLQECILYLTTHFSLDKLKEVLLYQPESPMLFSSGLFFILFIVFLFLFIPLRKKTTARILYVTLFSLYFYYKSSGIWFLLLIFTATSDFLIGRGIASADSPKKKKGLVLLSLLINLGMLAYFKYTNFLYDSAVAFLQSLGEWCGIDALSQLTYTPLQIFLPIGISFFTFQSLSYTIDVYRGRISPLRRWLDYLFYVSFFPGLVAGPIVRARDFIPQMFHAPQLPKKHLGEAYYLIICGLIKKCIISDYISQNFVDRIFDAPTLYSGIENLIGVYGYALQIYCDFSGYSDMAIGLALLLGIRFNINFDAPYQSASITEFWRRWHISLSSWLKDYLYISLGGNRKGRARMYLNLFITMLLGGLWHGAALKFILWGALHGVALAIHKFLTTHLRFLKPTGAEMGPSGRFFSVLLTFHFVCFCWIFFRADSIQKGMEMLSQIFTSFHPELLLPFILGYKGIFFLLIVGYIAHFTPKRIDQKIQAHFTWSPFVLRSLYLTLVIFVIIQIKSAGIVPFIYFQF